MADQNGRVAYQCNWCGQNLHELPDDFHSMAPRAIYVDDDGNQYCERYCRDMSTSEIYED